MSFRYAGLFAGIGGLELAAEACGGEPVFMCEQDEFCQRVLRRRFPGVPIIGDVHDVVIAEWAELVDMLVGGFPCQGVSAAGKGLGLADPRSGLWSEQFRIIAGLRPKIALIENVPLLRTRGLSKVLQDLDSIGYHAEWDIISAAAVGAPHLRERIWIIARPAEIAQGSVYGEPTGNPFGFLGKLPRAGRMGETLDELEPLAPRKTKRDGGWSYWAGVNLLGGEGTHLWPTAHGICSTDRRRAGPSGNELGFKVGQVESGRMLLPTPAASNYGNNQGGGAGRVGPVRHSLQSMAKNNLWPTPKATDADRGGRGDLIQVVRGNTSPSGHYGQSMFPTPNARDWKDSGPTQGNRKSPNLGTIAHLWPTPKSAVSGPDYARVNRERSGGDDLVTAVARMWRTPCASEGTGGSTDPKNRLEGGHTLNLREQVRGETGRGRGSLNPTWVEWLMGLPLWWTDPTVHSEFVTQVGWENEPLHVSPRTSSDINLRVSRLKACGNSVVWPCAYFALSRALEATPQAKH